MKQNKEISLLPLIFIIIGSSLLALPGIYGSIFLVYFAFEGLKSFNFLTLLLPVPALVGFALLFGYYHAIFRKKFVFAFWLSSAIYNFILAALSFFGCVYLFSDKTIEIYWSLFYFTFPIWTSFVAISSVYYLKRSDKQNKINLP